MISLRYLLPIVLLSVTGTLYAASSSDENKQGIEAVNAILSGDTALVRKMVEKGLPATAKGEYGITLLYAAAQNGDGDLVRFLLQRGADPNRVVMYNMTAMHAALDHPSLLKAMMEFKGNVNYQARDGESLLMNAASSSRPQAVRTLLELGASVKLTDNIGRGVMFYVMSNKQKYLDEIYPLLIAQGASLDEVDKEGNTLLMVTVQEGKVQQAQDLIERGQPLWVTNRKGKSVLDMLYGGGTSRQQLADILLARNPPQNILDNALRTTLETGEYWMSKKMLDAGARATDPQLLFVAIEGKSWEPLRQLLTLGLDPNIHSSKDNRTPLQHAVRAHNTGQVRLLLQYGAKISSVESDDLGVGDILSNEKREELMQLLINAGLSPKLDIYGESLRHYLKRSGKDNLVKLFDKPSRQGCLVPKSPLSGQRLMAKRKAFVGIWDRKFEDKQRYIFANDGNFMSEAEMFGIKQSQRGEWMLEDSHLVLHTTEKGKPETRRLGVHCIEKGRIVLGNSDEPMTLIKQPGAAKLPPVKKQVAEGLGPVGDKLTEAQAAKLLARIGCYSKAYTSDEERSAALMKYLKPSGIQSQEEMASKLGPYLQDKSFQGEHFMEMMTEMLRCREEI